MNKQSMAVKLVEAINSKTAGFLAGIFRADLHATYWPRSRFPRGKFFGYSREVTRAGTDRTLWVGSFEFVLSRPVAN